MSGTNRQNCQAAVFMAAITENDREVARLLREDMGTQDKIVFQRLLSKISRSVWQARLAAAKEGPSMTRPSTTEGSDA